MDEKACSIRMEQAKNNRSAQIARDNVLSFFRKIKIFVLVHTNIIQIIV